MVKSKRSRSEQDITPTHPNVAAIDIGSRMHVAAVPPGRDTEAVRTFGTCTSDLKASADWFERCGVRTIAMESTGVYWIPAYEILEQRGFEVMLVNARDAKHVPGRKTDVSDAQWLRRLHEYGLLRASFRPKGEVAALRAYLRQRERLLDGGATGRPRRRRRLSPKHCRLARVSPMSPAAGSSVHSRFSRGGGKRAVVARRWRQIRRHLPSPASCRSSPRPPRHHRRLR